MTTYTLTTVNRDQERAVERLIAREMIQTITTRDDSLVSAHGVVARVGQEFIRRDPFGTAGSITGPNNSNRRVVTADEGNMIRYTLHRGDRRPEENHFITRDQWRAQAWPYPDASAPALVPDEPTTGRHSRHGVPLVVGARFSYNNGAYPRTERVIERINEDSRQVHYSWHGPTGAPHQSHSTFDYWTREAEPWPEGPLPPAITPVEPTAMSAHGVPLVVGARFDAPAWGHGHLPRTVTRFDDTLVYYRIAITTAEQNVERDRWIEMAAPWTS
jgi:hypothetical protein